MKRGSEISIKFSSKYIALFTLVLITVFACEKEYFPQPPPPKVAKATTNLEAAFTTTPPLTLTDKFWKEADYLKVAVTDINKGLLYGDGLLNMTGTYNGLTSFNAGKDPLLTMKAAYDNSKLYLYMEWVDSDYDPSFATSIWEGPSDPLKASESTSEWTSQGNCDKIALAFDIANASSSAGTFTEKGCAAACHNNEMKPSAGKVDIWKWDLAISDALGYANDMISEPTGFTNDAGQAMATRNKVDSNDDRSAPAYEWDGSDQDTIRPDGKETFLDAGYYLLNKTPFIGDIHNGDVVYHHPTNGCDHCHGEHGEGGEATAFASVGFTRKHSRASIKTYAASSGHEGASYFSAWSESDKDDMIAYIKGLGGIPGYVLTAPTGSSADIWSVSNVSRNRINTSTPNTIYKVLLVRNLETGNADDVQFTTPSGKNYTFGVALMDNDGKNHIGSLMQTLTFKAK